MENAAAERGEEGKKSSNLPAGASGALECGLFKTAGIILKTSRT